MAQLDSTSGEKNAARVAVVAAGVVSPLGFGLTETLQSLREAQDCVTPVIRFSVAECRCKTAGQVPDDRLLADLNKRLRAKRLHRASHMMIQALREAITQAPQFEPELMVIGTTSGGMSYGEQYYRSLCQSGDLRQAPTWIANYPAQKPVIDAQDEVLGVPTPCQVIANACASGTNAIGHAFECVRSGRYQRVLTGGYDALSELVFTGFDSLQASTPEKCRPFDRRRTGMVLGEGAAILALENLALARKRGTPVLAEIVGYGISTDNFHITQPDPSGVGPRQAMERALHSAQISGDEVDYINAHGTATIFNDAAEGKAISELFNGVPVSSTKSMMGHSLGAAGAVEAVVCLLALCHQFLPPNINFGALDDRLDLNVVANESRPAVVRTALSNSFGFGGTNASILMRSAEA
ncbi:MAG TPA: beta-ketoacyl-[acyl-carrier-protein] synthase family protein [Candidatus Binatia bacterium]|jgi:3-oxoacyl-[acyl-carrier-protein] synthase II|nr:beta-ketoacyl-[acyl-carrier-protein] synthase family protein [Candidatus Binatia bacterium]